MAVFPAGVFGVLVVSLPTPRPWLMILFLGLYYPAAGYGIAYYVRRGGPGAAVGVWLAWVAPELIGLLRGSPPSGSHVLSGSNAYAAILLAALTCLGEFSPRIAKALRRRRAGPPASESAG